MYIVFIEYSALRNKVYVCMYLVSAEGLKLSKCGLGYYLDGSFPGKSNMMMEVMLAGQ